MNTHIANVRRATSVRTPLVAVQLREINELKTLHKQYHWDTESLVTSADAQIETLRFLLEHQHSQVGPPKTI